jgi:hypothetical protein
MNTVEIKTGQLLYEEITEHILSDEKPSDYLNRTSAEPQFNEYPFSIKAAIWFTVQNKKFLIIRNFYYCPTVSIHGSSPWYPGHLRS